ncbi:TetR/AcrR family transcriptional regulator [Aminipila sp.]|jgi:AcrR family transcriptional regulator|uniref:TetR/AcrR family transcriptional regulator n=1 Tax=Aminipila sp. TaxID=2060095 RepID=UPI001D35E5C4|nr:TetR/AcrR family transcriptional regulator [Aminipila sp.]MBE6033966.1 TetR/AcrR family transcriptional regulator [Clostridiales bacterium]
MDKKNEILNEAYRLFSQKGYSLSMSEIAKAVHIKTPSLYSHFNSKDEIIETIIKTEIENCFEAVHKIVSDLKDKNCQETLSYIFFHMIDYCKKSSRPYFLRHLSLLQNKKLRQMCTALLQECSDCFAEHIRQCFEKGIREKELKETVNEGQIYLYISMIQGILDSEFFIQDKKFRSKDYAVKVWEAYWDGIKA